MSSHTGTRTILDRFMGFVSPEPNSGCWLWMGYCQPTGYGHFGTGNGHIKKAHRFIYEYLHGPIRNGLDLDHLCRVRCCVNPQHLEPVSRAENLRRSPIVRAAIDKMNHDKRCLTHCSHGHEYTPINTRMLSDGSRKCRQCASIIMRNYYDRKKGVALG
jgi:hypothetical protein